MTYQRTTREGTCRSCNRKRQVYSITRRGGGTYRRGGRQYRSSICAECAMYLHAIGGTERFDRVALRDIAHQEAQS